MPYCASLESVICLAVMGKYDNYGFGLLAQPNRSLGQPVTTAGSQPIIIIGLPSTSDLPSREGEPLLGNRVFYPIEAHLSSFVYYYNSYDSVGNRLKKTENDAVTTYSYDDNDRLLTEDSNTYSWDNNGNMISKTDNSGVTIYSWDYENRLISAQTPTDLLYYAYDADGIRIQSNANEDITNYFVDHNRDYDQVLEEYDIDNNLIVSYTYGDDLLRQFRSSFVSYYHYDSFGTTRILTNNNGDKTNAYFYEAFGKVIEHT